MPEVLPSHSVNRWYRVYRSDTKTHADVFAEKYFDSEAEAFGYWQNRSATLGFDRVNRPVRSHENRAVWAVCVDAQQ